MLKIKIYWKITQKLRVGLDLYLYLYLITAFFTTKFLIFEHGKTEQTEK